MAENKDKKEFKPGDLRFGDLYRVRDGCQKLGNIESSAAFSLKIIQILRLVGTQLKDVEELKKPDEDYLKTYQPEIEKIAKKHCLKDQAGNPLPKVNIQGEPMFDFKPDDKKKFEEEIEKLEKKKEFADMVAKRKEQMEKYSDALAEVCEVKFPKIPEEMLPQQITPAQIDPIFELIEIS